VDRGLTRVRRRPSPRSSWSRRPRREPARGRALRGLKGTLLRRPIYHRFEERILAQIVTCWLALLLARLIERQAGDGWPPHRSPPT
jgi:hypothetical protein